MTHRGSGATPIAHAAEVRHRAMIRTGNAAVARCGADPLLGEVGEIGA